MNPTQAPIVKPFSAWSRRAVTSVFGLAFVEETPALLQWLATGDAPLPPEMEALLEKLRKRLRAHVASWNEAELLNRFISPLLFSIDFADEARGVEEYSERSLSFTFADYIVRGDVDWLVARVGAETDEPEAPYFFIHEYKRFKQNEADPLGQLLVEMIAAQKLNNDGFPLYGAWVRGAEWRFVLLDGAVYSESFVFDATSPKELAQIWLILDKTRRIIYDRVDKWIENKNKTS